MAKGARIEHGPLKDGRAAGEVDQVSWPTKEAEDRQLLAFFGKDGTASVSVV